MAIPGPGTAISMDTIATEFGGTVPHSLSEYYRGGGLVPNTPTNAAIPTSGQIAIGDFYGSSARTSISLVISGNTNNYDVYNNRGPTYTAGTSDITVTVNPGVTVGSTTVPAYAMLVPSSFSPTDTVTIINNGLIQGMGGTGGTGATAPTSVSPALATGGTGGSGGSALYVNRPTTVVNNSVIAAGGGGGGGGGAKYLTISPMAFVRGGGGGGGGGAGTSGGAPGPAGGGGPAVPAATAGSVGTSPAGGAGGSGQRSPSSPTAPAWVRGGNGGTGGGRGAAGSAGANTTQGPVGSPATPASGGGGGAAGNYIVGNPFVTWPVTGTRQGNVA